MENKKKYCTPEVHDCQYVFGFFYDAPADVFLRNVQRFFHSLKSIMAAYITVRDSFQLQIVAFPFYHELSIWYNFLKYNLETEDHGMKRLLIVDDEDKIREVIKEYAEFSGYVAEEAADGMSAIGMVKLNDYDLIIMDVMMPKLDGFSAVKEIQKIKNIPVIMLSARGEEYDKLFGFELGIDDYVVKPFSPKELMARVNAVLSRVDASDKSSQSIERFDGLEVNFAARTISVDGKRIELTPKEYDLLFYMIQNKNIALSRDRLLSDIWGYDFFGDDRTIDTHVKNLRNSLGPYRKFIVTLRGVGYKFEYEG